MAIEGSDFCPMVIDPMIECEDIESHDLNEIQDSFFDRFTYESDIEYDDSYDSTPLDDDDYDIVSMITDFDLLQERVCNNHEWGMMTTEETVVDFAEEDPKQIVDPGSKQENPGSDTEQEEDTASVYESNVQLLRVPVGEATRQMGTVRKAGRDIGA
jgi:hypothetical protein